ncbi:hypothetical protein [Novispirillum itersonii]|uniref:Uncharacterized protein n=1 Tax=Novispirillum itersonii TaxID=189 RepID=A0A7W9ZHU6_NOVIT|nr:hypothetical protein [Novispirillum itersonii]MBB6210369.1 hypothetical protein [Novispirillum itersonii]
MSKLDLATRIISEDHGVWAMFPGRGKKFLDSFRANSVVFLDVPGISLTPDVLADDELLKKHIGMARSVQSWHQNKKVDAEPSRNPADYNPRQTRNLISALGNVRALFDTAEVGDLILVASRDMYEPILVGEIRTPFDPEDVINFHIYDQETIPVRRVRWLPIRVLRTTLSKDLSNLLSNQHAILTVRKGLRAEIYNFSYNSYVYDGGGRYQFDGLRYSKNALATIPAIQLISYFVAAFHAQQIGELNQFNALSVCEAINNYFEQDTLNYFQMNFNSPGWFTLGAKIAALGLFVAAGVAATGALSYEEAKNANLSNSFAMPQNACMVTAEQSYRVIMDQMGAARYNELMCMNQDAQAGVGLATSVMVDK